MRSGEEEERGTGGEQRQAVGVEGIGMGAKDKGEAGYYNGNHLARLQPLGHHAVWGRGG